MSAAQQATAPVVVAVSRNAVYSFTKPVRDEIVLVAGIGIDGDVHAGEHVRHRGRVRADPTQPNLRQVHLIQGELFEEVAAKGYRVGAGQLGENVTTGGVDLLGLPLGTVLRFGPPGGAAKADESVSAALEPLFAVARTADLDGPSTTAVEALRAAVAREAGHDPRPSVILAGLRNPCAQINTFRPGLLKEVVERDAVGNTVRKAGVMAVVLRGGPIRPGDPVTVELPPEPLLPLERV